MKLRSILFVLAMVFVSQSFADESKKEQDVDVELSYCQQLGKTTGFEGSDLEEFIKECEDNRAEESKRNEGQ